MKLDIYQVDAFASELFKGNPAAVCPLGAWLPDQQLQNIAMENNLSETAFFVPDGGRYRLRWFTPKAEVDLCGHATLAAAHVLFSHLNYAEDEISFDSRSGVLRVRREGACYMMDFPAARLKREAPPLDLYHALGGAIADEVYKDNDFLWVLEAEEDVRGMEPDFRLMEKVDTRGVIVTAPGDEVDFVSRFFAPSVGVDEDPVTGSAHTMLIPYWAKRLNKDRLTARQISRRGGELTCRMNGERVEIGGEAQTYLTGTIQI